jgi:subtilase family serine protease
MAGIQALIDQKMGARQGNPNYTYYKLAAAEHGAKGSARCNSSGGTSAAPVLPAPGCIFNDVTQGDMDVNCSGPIDCYGTSGAGKNAVQGVLSTSSATLGPAYAAGTGWDFATGLGTVNAYNLVTAWSD